MSKIQDDKLVRKTLIEDTSSPKTFRSDVVITKEEFLACYNKWVLKPMQENYVKEAEADDYKEAIELIQGIEEDGRNVTIEHKEALDLAIKALEFTDDFFHLSFISYLNGVFGNYVDGGAE